MKNTLKSIQSNPSPHMENQKRREALVLKANNICGSKTVSLRPYTIYGEGCVTFSLLLKDGVIMVADEKLSLCYSGNLAYWLLVADKALDEKGDLVSGKAYFVADDNEPNNSK